MKRRYSELYDEAYAYHNGFYDRRDYKKAYELFKYLYENRYSLPDTCFYMGYYAENGLARIRDYKAALAYYREGERHKSGYCVTNIGKMYYDGRGVKRNHKKAFKYYEKAVELGDTMGYANLAYCYEKGIGTKMDIAKAIKLYKVAAMRGDTYSIDALKRNGEELSMGKSLYEIICENINEEGKLSNDFSLPKVDKEGVVFADGAMDGVALYHMGPDEVDEEIKNGIADLIKTISSGDFVKSDEILARIVNKASAFSIIDDLQHCIYDNAGELSGENLFNYAVYLLKESEGREQVKVGVEILEIMQPDEQEKEIIRTLGLSDEFALFAVFCMKNWDDSENEIFELAKKVEGWGRIHAVKHLEPVNEEIKKWLLTDGVDNWVMSAYSGLVCYEKLDVESLLDRESLTEEELRGALKIIDAMLDEGPVEGISALEDPEGILVKVLEHAEKNMPLTIEQYEIINNISDWQEEEGEDDNHDMEVLVDSILGSDACKESVKNSIKKCKGIGLARALKIPYKEDVYKCLQEDFDKYEYAFQYLVKDPEYTDKIIDLFMKNIDLESIKTGPEDNLGLDAKYRNHHRLSLILSALVSLPGKGDAFIEAGIQSPVCNNRSQAIQNVREWVSNEKKALSVLSPELYEVFLKMRDKEVLEDFKTKIERIVAGDIEFADEDDENE